MRIRTLTLALLAALLLGIGHNAGHSAPLPAARQPATPAPASVDTAEAALPPVADLEARLRKLHLVRPDLIPYPLAYDVYC